MFDFLKNLEYHVGIIFNQKTGEFHSDVTTKAMDAYEVARNAEKDEPYKMTLYVKLGKETKEIPYSQIRHLDTLAHSQLEREIERMSRELFKKAKAK